MHLKDYDPEIFDDNDFYHQVCTTEQKVLVFFISVYKKFHLKSYFLFSAAFERIY